MKDLIEKVKEFHRVFKIDETQNYKLNPSCCTLRKELMREENQEYLDACAANDDVEIADALGDQLYILCGTIIAHGLEDKIEEVFNEIHRSNMSKLENGEPIYHENGKVKKGKDYFRPNIKQILNQQTDAKESNSSNQGVSETSTPTTTRN